MNLKLNYKSREVSTEDIIDVFDPPLIFSVKTRATSGWFDDISGIEADTRDIDLALRIITGICFSVSDGNISTPLVTTDDARSFYASLHDQSPEMASEIICDISYELAGEFVRYHHKRLVALKKTSNQSDIGNNGKDTVLAS